MWPTKGVNGQEVACQEFHYQPRDCSPRYGQPGEIYMHIHSAKSGRAITEKAFPIHTHLESRIYISFYPNASTTLMCQLKGPWLPKDMG